MYEELEQMASDFEQEMAESKQKKKEAFLISIIWIGYSIYSGLTYVEELITKKGIQINDTQNKKESE